MRPSSFASEWPAARLGVAIVVLGSVPAGVALLLLLGSGVLVGMLGVLPPLAAAAALGERVWPALLERELVQAAIVATAVGAGVVLLGDVLASQLGRSLPLEAALIGLVLYAAGSVALLRSGDVRLHWPALTAAAGLATVAAGVTLG